MKLTAMDACRLLKINSTTLYRWIHEEELPAEWWNAQPFFHPARVLEWATMRNRRIDPAIFHGDDDLNEPRLSYALTCGGVFHDVEGGEIGTFLSHLVARLPLPEEIDRAGLADWVLARGGRTMTGIGGGIAIPHPLQPIIVPGRRPSVTLCFLKEPIALNAQDGQPVSAVFAVVSPQVSLHLRLLARLAVASRDLGILQCLRLQQSQELIHVELERHETELSSRSVSI